jgi:hypothetical protein
MRIPIKVIPTCIMQQYQLERFKVLAGTPEMFT